jgi:hypothetical protein
MKLPEIILLPLQPDDREQFILDNQWAFKYGAQQEFGMRDERCEEGEEVISRKTCCRRSTARALARQRGKQLKRCIRRSRCGRAGNVPETWTTPA